VHATLGDKSEPKMNLTAAIVQSLIARASNAQGEQVPVEVPEMSKEEILRTLERLMAT
jgi:hypothetical protein